LGALEALVSTRHPIDGLPQERQVEPKAALDPVGPGRASGSVRRVEVVPAQSLPSLLAAVPPPASAAPSECGSIRLVSRALAGDTAAFGELIDRHERAALAVAYGVTRDAGLAADAVQEACLKAWHKRHSLADPDRFAGWLLHIVRRCALDQVRSRKPVQSLATQEPERTTADDGAMRMMRRETDDRIRGALEELDDESRLAVVMRYYHGASAREIAELLGCSPAAVDMRLKRARDRLRERLAGLVTADTRIE
jgi:RNA polymerase sigma factor (sigma-70 family)